MRRSVDVGVRDAAEIEELSADTYAFATISEHSRLWGSRIRAMPRNEGAGFPGFTILTFAAAACGIGLARAVVHARRGGVQSAGWRRVVAVAAGATLILLLGLLGHTLVTGQLTISAAGLTLYKRSTVRLLAEIAIVAAAWLLASPKARRIARGVPGSTLGFFAVAAVAAVWLSLGPEMHANGHGIGPGLYDIFYRWVPGFDGLRVVSLYFMLVTFFLAVLAGLGAAALLAGGYGARRLVVVIGMVAIMAESWTVPTSTNVRVGAQGYALPSIDVAATPRFIDQMIGYLPAGTVLAEFPFGVIAYEIRYTFYAGYLPPQADRERVLRVFPAKLHGHRGAALAQAGE